MSGRPPPGFTKLLDGANWHEVVSAVNCANWVTSPNPRCRTKSERERWVLARFLLAPETQSLLRPPLTVYEGDKPDFWMITDGRIIGVEVAEIVHQIEAKARRIARDNDQEMYFPPHPQDFPTRQSRKELPQYMLRGGRPWIGSEPELSFAELACSLITKKSKKHPHYVASDASLLLVYKNTAMPFSEERFRESGACEKISACAQVHRDKYERVAIWMGQNLRVF